VAHYVLVHGAWHGSWCFSEVVAELERLGHTATAPELPCEDVGYDQFDYARLIGPQPGAIVVGHSLGGATIPHVEAGLRVYLAPVLPLEKVFAECFVPTFGGTVRDELGRSYWPDADAAHAGMYPECTRAQSDSAFARLRRQSPISPVAARFGAGDVLIATMRDRAIDPAYQVRRAREHGARLIELDSGHSPFITQPTELAEILSTLAG
jgi:pimeloyl-ACP methyl ester carboxylesterase